MELCLGRVIGIRWCLALELSAWRLDLTWVGLGFGIGTTTVEQISVMEVGAMGYRGFRQEHTGLVRVHDCFSHERLRLPGLD